MRGKTNWTLSLNQDRNTCGELANQRHEKSALILTGDDRVGENLPAIVSECELDPVRACSVGELRLGALDKRTALVLCEEVLPDGDFRDALRIVSSIARRVPVLVFSRVADWDTYLRAMRLGAYDCLRFPFRSGELQRIVRQIVGIPRQNA